MKTALVRLLALLSLLSIFFGFVMSTEPATKPVTRYISGLLASPGVVNAARQEHGFDLTWSSVYLFDLPEEGAPWALKSSSLTEGVVFEKGNVPFGYDRGEWAQVEMDDEGRVARVELAPMRRWKGELCFQSQAQGELSLPIRVRAPHWDSGAFNTGRSLLFHLPFALFLTLMLWVAFSSSLRVRVLTRRRDESSTG